ncbi:ElaA protein [Tenacibaculum adriaticum]|uniref:ElaA protein n=1 Tax=Tenacibaculum adriaticum TaxID=413713 RepID=A0A5S5DX49_9FLAO|nr:GNAT family N-acetyltransferase [Tenacibaculum adriaticum]TYP99838.1 ElaA protein [Tenacibaculum adriaticum]
MDFLVKTFEELTTLELYDLLQLRSDVFVVEQDCVFLDLDGKDQQAIHVLGKKNDKIVAYTRLFQSGDYYKESSIGRVVVKQEERKYGYGHDLMDFSIQTIKKLYNTSLIKIGAQKYLKKFYESHGFIQIGDEYLEDGIIHIYMIKK